MEKQERLEELRARIAKRAEAHDNVVVFRRSQQALDQQGEVGTLLAPCLAFALFSTCCWLMTCALRHKTCLAYSWKEVYATAQQGSEWNGHTGVSSRRSVEGQLIWQSQCSTTPAGLVPAMSATGLLSMTARLRRQPTKPCSLSARQLGGQQSLSLGG